MLVKVVSNSPRPRSAVPGLVNDPSPRLWATASPASSRSHSPSTPTVPVSTSPFRDTLPSRPSNVVPATRPQAVRRRPAGPRRRHARRPAGRNCPARPAADSRHSRHRVSGFGPAAGPWRPARQASPPHPPRRRLLLEPFPFPSPAACPNARTSRSTPDTPSSAPSVAPRWPSGSR